MIPNLRYHGNPNVEQSSTVHKNSILDIWYFLLAKMYVSTAFKVYIAEIYFPHIENKKLSNIRNLRHHGNNTIKLS